MKTEIKRSRNMPLFMIGLSLFYLWGVIPNMWATIQTGQFISLRFFLYLIAGGIFIWQAVRFLRHLLNQNPAIIIDEKGFYDHVSPFKVGLIPWENIARLEYKEKSINRRLVIQLHDPETLINTLSGMKAKMANSLLQTAGSPIVIHDHMIRPKLTELIKLIEAKMPNEQQAD
ncbi:MAG: STM3941 family protein [Bacteroidota bacterium]